MTPEPGREALAAIVAGEPVEPWGIVRRGLDGKLAIYSPKFNAVKARFTSGNATGWDMHEPLYRAAQLAKVEAELNEWRGRAVDRCAEAEKWFRKYGAEIDRATTAEARAEAAEERVAVLEEALKPFNDAADEIEEKYGAVLPDWQVQFPELTMKDFRRARNALKRETQNADQ